MHWYVGDRKLIVYTSIRKCYCTLLPGGKIDERTGDFSNACLLVSNTLHMWAKTSGSYTDRAVLLKSNGSIEEIKWLTYKKRRLYVIHIQICIPSTQRNFHWWGSLRWAARQSFTFNSFPVRTDIAYLEYLKIHNIEIKLKILMKNSMKLTRSMCSIVGNRKIVHRGSDCSPIYTVAFFRVCLCDECCYRWKTFQAFPFVDTARHEAAFHLKIFRNLNSSFNINT